MTEKNDAMYDATLADLARLMERVVSQQRQMSHYLMLLQEEAGTDDRFAALEDQMRAFTTDLERLDATLSRLASLR